LPQPAELTILYRKAAEATALGSKSFHFATRFFPPALARSAHAVYWFCRTTDDIVDQAASPASARSGIDAWEQATRRALAGAPTDDPVLTLFALACAEHAIPHQYPLDLIAGVRMDLEPARYRDFEELRVYCYRVASVVGLMMMHVIGFEGQPHRQAIDLGIAMQLTNILRDVGEDLARGRVYIPLDELDRFGCSLDSLAARHRDQGFLRLMRFQAERARQFYRSGESGIPALSSDGRFAVVIASQVYSGILDRIAANGYDVLDRRAVVPKLHKYWIAARALSGPVLRRSIGW
jgi:phytoene synthase